MAQLSRPYQVALILVAVLALAWFTVLRSHASTSSGGSSSASSSSSSASSTQPKAGSIESDEGKPTAVYHGAAPGLHGLSKDIRRAHEAVGASEAQARKLEGKASSAQAPARPASSTSIAAASKPAGAAHEAKGAHIVQRASRAQTVGAQLHSGKIVLLLFWDPRSSADQEVHSQVQAVGRSLKGKVALDFAKASEVSSFGTVTRDISVLQTPTLLIINRKGLATTIAGLTDAFSIEQAVREAGG